LLYEREGVWMGKPIVPQPWLVASVEPSPADVSYGYQWWLTGRWESRLPPDTFAAEGVDGQFIYVIPSLDLVVVRNGTYHKYDGEPIADPNLFARYPNDGLVEGLGTSAPDSWSDFDFLKPILDSIVE
jgi:CubicO group peptidase (beta-lactamase class C family)